MVTKGASKHTSTEYVKGLCGDCVFLSKTECCKVKTWKGNEPKGRNLCRRRKKVKGKISGCVLLLLLRPCVMARSRSKDQVMTLMPPSR